MTAPNLQPNIYGNPAMASDQGPVLNLVAQGAGTVISAVRYNPTSAMRVYTNITAITGTITVSVQLVDTISGATTTLLSGAGISATGTNVLKITPYIAASANAIAQDYAGPNYQVTAVVAGGSVTATIAVHHLNA